MNCKTFPNGWALLKRSWCYQVNLEQRGPRDCPSRSMIKVWPIVRIEADKIIHQLIFLHYLHPCIHHSNHHHITHQLNFLRRLHHHIQHSNHHYISHRLIFLNHHYYTPLHPSTNLQLVLSRDRSVTKKTRHYTATSNLLFKVFGQ